MSRANALAAFLRQILGEQVPAKPQPKRKPQTNRLFVVTPTGNAVVAVSRRWAAAHPEEETFEGELKARAVARQRLNERKK